MREWVGVEQQATGRVSSLDISTAALYIICVYITLRLFNENDADDDSIINESTAPCTCCCFRFAAAYRRKRELSSRQSFQTIPVFIFVSFFFYFEPIWNFSTFTSVVCLGEKVNLIITIYKDNNQFDVGTSWNAVTHGRVSGWNREYLIKVHA